MILYPRVEIVNEGVKRLGKQIGFITQWVRARETPIRFHIPYLPALPVLHGKFYKGLQDDLSGMA
jgi:hypothetical protein